MKIIVQSMLLLILCQLSVAQKSVLINKTNGETDTIAIADIKNITFLRMNIPQSDTCIPPLDSVVAWFQFDDTTTDAMNGRIGTRFGQASFGMGVVREGLELDGFGSFCSFPDTTLYDLKTSLSIVCWVKLSAPISAQPYPGWRGNYSIIIEKGNGDYHYRNYGLYFSRADNTLCFNGADTANTNYVFLTILEHADSLFDDLDWHHVAAVWNRSTATSSIFIDGKLLVSTSGTNGDLTTNDETLKIGAEAADQFFLDGSVDEVLIFGRAITPTEVEALYNSGAKGVCR